MISSQEGTEDRRPLALFLLPGRWRADWSSVGSARAGCAGVVVAEAAGDSTVTGAAAGALTGSTAVGSARVTGSGCAPGASAAGLMGVVGCGAREVSAA